METPSTTTPLNSQPEKHDISRRTIVILLILVTLLSCLSTFSVLNELNKVQAGPATVVEAPHGRIQLTILKEPEPSTATGKVVFGIKDEKTNSP